MEQFLDVTLCVFCAIMGWIITYWGWILGAIVYLALSFVLAVIIGRACKGN